MEPYRNLPYNLVMDMKNKLENAYMPDNKSRKEKIVLGLSGGLDSSVTAYLLKIQKYELIAVTIVNSLDDYPGDQSKLFSCQLNPVELEKLKDFCHKLGIPHHIIKAGPIFKENVLGPWMDDKILGRLPTPCWSCHEMRMQLLYEKMNELGAKHMATGHYAKLFHHDVHGSVFVHTSNEEKFDQSALLSRLPREILNSLILPLSDLTKKEVLKLAENFGIQERTKELSFNQCLKEDMTEYIEKITPKRFLKEGEITDLEEQQNLGEHEGIHQHQYGEEIELNDSGPTIKGRLGEYAYASKKMLVVNDDYFLRKKIMLVNCRLSEEVSWLEPIKGFMVYQHDQYIECWIHPKNLSAVFLEFFEEQDLLEGEIVSVIKKKGKNSKVYLTGEIRFLPLDPVNEEGEPIVPKVNYSIDF